MLRSAAPQPCCALRGARRRRARLPPACASEEPADAPTDVLSLLVQRLRDDLVLERAKNSRLEALLRTEREEAVSASRSMAEAAAKTRAQLEANILAERRAGVDATRSAQALVSQARREAAEALLEERALHTAATAAAAREAAAQSAEQVRRLEMERRRVRELEAATAALRTSSGDMAAQASRLRELRRSTAEALRAERVSGEAAERPGEPQRGETSAQLVRDALERERLAREEASALRLALAAAEEAVSAERALRLVAEDELIRAYDSSRGS